MLSASSKGRQRETEQVTRQRRPGESSSQDSKASPCDAGAGRQAKGLTLPSAQTGAWLAPRRLPSPRGSARRLLHAEEPRPCCPPLSDRDSKLTGSGAKRGCRCPPSLRPGPGQVRAAAAPLEALPPRRSLVVERVLLAELPQVLLLLLAQAAQQLPPAPPLAHAGPAAARLGRRAAPRFAAALPYGGAGAARPRGRRALRVEVGAATVEGRAVGRLEGVPGQPLCRCCSPRLRGPAGQGAAAAGCARCGTGAGRGDAEELRLFPAGRGCSGINAAGPAIPAQVQKREEPRVCFAKSRVSLGKPPQQG